MGKVTDVDIGGFLGFGSEVRIFVGICFLSADVYASVGSTRGSREVRSVRVAGGRFRYVVISYVGGFL